MARKSWGKHTTTVTTPDDGTSEVGTDEWNADHVTDGLMGFTKQSATISSNDIVPAATLIEVQASGTLNTLTPTDNNEFDIIYLIAASGATVTVTHDAGGGAGKIRLLKSANKTLNTNYPTILMCRTISSVKEWVEIASDVVSANNLIGTTLAGTVVSSSLTTVGTIGTGTWQGTAIADAYLGTGINANKLADGSVSNTEFQYINSLTSNAQTQIDGKQATLTFGIADTNAVKIDDADAADNDYAKLTASGVEGRSYAEVKTDLSLDNVENTAISTFAGTSNITTLGTITTGTWNGSVIDHERGGLEADVSAYDGIVKISGGSTSAVTAPSGTIVGTSDTQTLTNKTISGSSNTLSNIANGSLTNSVIGVTDGSTSTNVSLGGTITFSGTSNEVEVGESSGTITIGLPNDVTIGGNLTVSGTTTTVNTSTLSVEDPLIKLANGNNGSDSVDIGIYGLYDTTGSQDVYSGIFRDANDSGKWKIFKDLQAEPTTTVDTSGTGYAVGTLVANLEGNADTATLATTVTITDNESTNEDNALIFTSGGDVDGGNLGLESDGTCTYNPSTGKITATGFIGDLTGNADTVTTNANLTGDITSTGNATAIAAGVIIDADVKSDAAIAFSKLASLTSANILVGNGSNVATAVSISGDATLANDGTLSLDADVNVKGKQDMWVPANAMHECTTSGCDSVQTVELGTNDIDVKVLDFDKATDERCQFAWQPPRNYNNGTVKVTFYWMANATTGDCVWNIKAGAFSNDDALDAALGSVVAVTDSATAAAYDLLISSQSGDITINGSPADSDMIIFEISRDADNGSDTLDADARLLGVSIEYTLDSAVAA